MPMPATNHTEAIRHFITSTLGFDLAGIAAAERMDREADLFEEWLAHGHHGTMEWIARNNHKRRDVRQILPSARSVIVVARNYYTPFHHAANPDHAKISRYAWGRDYHNILPKKIEATPSVYPNAGTERRKPLVR
ncbi:MAG: Fe-S protein [Chlorobi bacterium OLB7]|nr:MAG: Fe-S protein [Chlorobi bacterium OLB7]